MMKTNYVEIQYFINNFLVEEVRKGYLSVLERGKRGGSIISSMSNLTCLDNRYCTKIPRGSKKDNITFIKNAISKKVISNTCKIFSPFEMTNGKEFDIDKALELALTSGGPTVILFKPNTIAYYESESSGEMYVCIK